MVAHFTNTNVGKKVRTARRASYPIYSPLAYSSSWILADNW